MTHETVDLRGLQFPAEIRIDRWGLAHLKANSKHDIFFLQGYNAARDRLWQIDLWRKRGLGRLSASFGPGYLEQDVAARTFLFRGEISAEWIAYGPDMEEICSAFVEGINAYIDQSELEPELLPPEFELTATRPEHWQPEDVVRIRSHALTRNGVSEVLRSIIQSRFGATADLVRKNVEPARQAENAADLDLSQIPLEIIDLFRLATAQVSFSEARLGATLAEAGKWRKVNDLTEVVEDGAWTGSNNWVVAGSHSQTGRPIMAGDPHRSHALPSLRYVVHLTCPEFDVVGAGEPAIPGISMGHNGVAAFTLTIFGSDQEDVYVYELNPENPEEYWYSNSWEPIRTIDDVFEIKGYPSLTRQLRFTRHGPLLYHDTSKGAAFAMRSVWFEPGTGAYLAGVETMRAKDLESFRAGVSKFKTPAVNHLYADTAGTIAWVPYGLTPVRTNWDGLLPVSGDGRFEWSGYLLPESFPSSVSPAQGYLYSANEANLPTDWDHNSAQIGFEWLEKSRAIRIDEVLRSGSKVSISSAAALQTDVTSIPARRLEALLQKLNTSGDTELAAAARLLMTWDFQLTENSAAAALSEIWYGRHLRPFVVAITIPDQRFQALMSPGDVEGTIQALEDPDDRFGEQPTLARDAILSKTLVAAWREAHALLGPDVANWSWGRLHHGYFEHALSTFLGPDWKAMLDVGPLAKGGSASTVMHAAYRASDFRVTTGASVRLVMDVGDWDQSLFINAPGMSGDPRSPHYRDLAKQWASGEYAPLLYSDDAVEKATTRRIVFRPG